jgi:hypothetical protein
MLRMEVRKIKPVYITFGMTKPADCALTQILASSISAHAMSKENVYTFTSYACPLTKEID